MYDTVPGVGDLLCTPDWSRGSSVSTVTKLWLDDLAVGAKFMAGSIDFRTVFAAHPVSFPVHSGDIFLGGKTILDPCPPILCHDYCTAHYRYLQSHIAWNWRQEYTNLRRRWPWRLMLVDPQSGPGSMSPVWHLEFWCVSRILGKFAYPWIDCLRNVAWDNGMMRVYCLLVALTVTLSE
jgi:hypothetical protein